MMLAKLEENGQKDSLYFHSSLYLFTKSETLNSFSRRRLCVVNEAGYRLNVGYL